MRYFVLERETTVAEIAGKAYRNLPAAERRKAEEALVRANPRLKDMARVKAGALIRIPDSTATERLDRRNVVDPVNHLADDVADQLDAFRDEFRASFSAWEKQAAEYPDLIKAAGKEAEERPELKTVSADLKKNLRAALKNNEKNHELGTDALKQKLLPRLLSGEDIWCQGFSEPGAGSDLASVQTFAEQRGDKWVINGHKVWTSLAHFAEWMILLLRTDKSHKYDGLSYFVVPIRSALGQGVTVRPLIKMTGETGFNEVIFEDLEVGVLFRDWEEGGVKVTFRSKGRVEVSAIARRLGGGGRLAGGADHRASR